MSFLNIFANGFRSSPVAQAALPAEKVSEGLVFVAQPLLAVWFSDLSRIWEAINRENQTAKSGCATTPNVNPFPGVDLNPRLPLQNRISRGTRAEIRRRRSLREDFPW